MIVVLGIFFLEDLCIYVCLRVFEVQSDRQRWKDRQKNTFLLLVNALSGYGNLV